MLCVTNLPPCLFDHTPPGVFDGQGSGHDFYGTMWNPPSGFVSGMDGDRAGHFNCDYRQVPQPYLNPTCAPQPLCFRAGYFTAWYAHVS
jgi:hypothetical protein